MEPTKTTELSAQLVREKNKPNELNAPNELNSMNESN